MASKNLTAVLYKKDDLRLEDRAIPEPGHGQVQLRMEQVGICGSDVHYWTHGSIGDFVLKSPMVMGHEASGVVSKLGQGVTSLKVGDRVAIEPGVPCRRCNYCKAGRYNLCPDMQFCATPPHDGSLANFYVHDADFCFKLPDHVSFEEGALLEPLSVGVHACNRANVGLGNKVFICGAGPIGIVNLLVAKARGAACVVISDLDQSRLDFARKMGADHVIQVKSKEPKDTASLVEEALGEAADITIECSGAPPSIRTAIYATKSERHVVLVDPDLIELPVATKSGGCVVLVGLGPDLIELPVVNASVREVDIRGIFRYVNCYPTALAMISSGKVNVKPLVTHRFSLEQSLDAFEAAKRGEGVKIMISCVLK